MKTKLLTALLACMTFSLAAADYYDAQARGTPSNDNFYSEAYPYTNNREARSYSGSNYYYPQNESYTTQNYSRNANNTNTYSDQYPYNNYRQSAYRGYDTQNGYSSFQNSSPYNNRYQDQYPYYNYRDSANKDYVDTQYPGYSEQNTPAQNTMYQRNEHMGDWDFQGNWRYDRDAYLRGETQPQAYRESHRGGTKRIGYDNANTP
jgi:hypothetical protein